MCAVLLWMHSEPSLNEEATVRFFLVLCFCGRGNTHLTSPVTFTSPPPTRTKHTIVSCVYAGMLEELRVSVDDRAKNAKARAEQIKNWRIFARAEALYEYTGMVA